MYCPNNKQEIIHLIEKNSSLFYDPYGENQINKILKRIDIYEDDMDLYDFDIFVDDLEQLAGEDLDESQKETLRKIASVVDVYLRTLKEQSEPCPPSQETAYKVILIDGGKALLHVVKILINSCNLNLIEAKKLVDAVPSCVKEGITLSEAEALKKRFEEVGAQVQITK